MLQNLRCSLKSSLHLTSQPSEKHCHYPWNPLLILLPLGWTHSPFLLPTPPFLPKILSFPELDSESPPLLNSLLCFIVICVSHCSLPRWIAQTLPMIKCHVYAMCPTFIPVIQALFWEVSSWSLIASTLPDGCPQLQSSPLASILLLFLSCFSYPLIT